MYRMLAKGMRCKKPLEGSESDQGECEAVSEV